jgi:hypothetical protein
LGASGKRRLRREPYGDGGEPSRTCAANRGDLPFDCQGIGWALAICASQEEGGESQCGHRTKLSLRCVGACAASVRWGPSHTGTTSLASDASLAAERRSEVLRFA